MRLRDASVLWQHLRVSGIVWPSLRDNTPHWTPIIDSIKVTMATVGHRIPLNPYHATVPHWTPLTPPNVLWCSGWKLHNPNKVDSTGEAHQASRP